MAQYTSHRGTHDCKAKNAVWVGLFHSKTAFFRNRGLFHCLRCCEESYELGDYTRAEWLSRRENEAAELSKQKKITDLNRQLKAISLVNSIDWLNNINVFWNRLARLLLQKSATNYTGQLLTG